MVAPTPMVGLRVSLFLLCLLSIPVYALSESAALLKGLFVGPQEDLPRLVYADWLDERGRPDAASIMRNLVALRALRRLANRFEVDAVRDRLAWEFEIKRIEQKVAFRNQSAQELSDNASEASEIRYLLRAFQFLDGASGPNRREVDIGYNRKEQSYGFVRIRSSEKTIPTAALVTGSTKMALHLKWDRSIDRSPSDFIDLLPSSVARVEELSRSGFFVEAATINDNPRAGYGSGFVAMLQDKTLTPRLWEVRVSPGLHGEGLGGWQRPIKKFVFESGRGDRPIAQLPLAADLIRSNAASLEELEFERIGNSDVVDSIFQNLRRFKNLRSVGFHLNRDFSRWVSSIAFGARHWPATLRVLKLNAPDGYPGRWEVAEARNLIRFWESVPFESLVILESDSAPGLSNRLMEMEHSTLVEAKVPLEVAAALLRSGKRVHPQLHRIEVILPPYGRINDRELAGLERLANANQVSLSVSRKRRCSLQIADAA